MSVHHLKHVAAVLPLAFPFYKSALRKGTEVKCECDQSSGSNSVDIRVTKEYWVHRLLSRNNMSIDDLIMVSNDKWNRIWDYDWDGKSKKYLDTDNKNKSNKNKEVGNVQKVGVTRHILLIRHGQYNLESKEQDLTDLGRDQSRITGLRLKQMTESIMSDHYGTRKICIKEIRSSTKTRAKETAEIIKETLGNPNIPYEVQDPLLDEGCPCLPLPCSSATYQKANVHRTRKDGSRMEAAFRKYVE